jgi:hypothetical protein
MPCRDIHRDIPADIRADIPVTLPRDMGRLRAICSLAMECSR